MAKKEAPPTFRVTSMLEDGTVEVAEGVENPPKKGDSFEYEHHEVRVGQIIRVENEAGDAVPDLGDLDHTLVESVEGDEIPTPDELAEDPKE